MTDATDIADKADRLRQQLEAKYGVKSRTLAQALKRTGRRLPRRLRAQGQVLVRAQGMAGNPQVARQIAQAPLQKAYDEISGHLAKIDVAERRKDRLIRLAAAVAFNILLVTVVFVGWLWWRGYV